MVKSWRVVLWLEGNVCGSGSDLNLLSDGSVFPLSEAVRVCIWGRRRVDSGAGLGSSENHRIPKTIAQSGNRIKRNKHNRKKMYGKNHNTVLYHRYIVTPISCQME